MRYFFTLCIAVFILVGCEHKVPAFQGKNGDMSVWFDAYGDLTKDIGAYLNYENGKLVPTLSWHMQRDSMEFLQDMRVWLEGYSKDSLLVIEGEFPGAIKMGYEGESYAGVRNQILTYADSLKTEVQSIQAQTAYPILATALPESIYLNYSVAANTGTTTGKVLFIKTGKTIVETMRFH